MIVRYIGLTKYNDIKKNININLGGKYRFYLNEDRMIELVKDEDYVTGVYLYGDKISDISAIVGKNGAGKTSVLRMISGVIGGKGKDYVLIEEDSKNKRFFIHTDMDIDYSQLYINFKLDGYELVKNTKRNTEELVQIYFSNIFDKATPLSSTDNLIDISTNKELRKFFPEEELEAADYRWNDSWIEEMNQYDEKSIYAFTKSEMPKKMELAYQLNATNNFENSKLLFSFPDYIDIYISEKSELINKIVDKIGERISTDDKEQLDIITSSLNREINSKEDFLNEMCACLLQELILRKLYEDQISFSHMKNVLHKERNVFSFLRHIFDQNEIYEEKRKYENKKKVSKKQKKEKYREKSSADSVIFHVEKLIWELEERDYYLEYKEIFQIEKELIYINSLMDEISNSQNSDIMETINEDLFRLKDEYSFLEIEDVELVVEHIVYALTDLRTSIFDGKKEIIVNISEEENQDDEKSIFDIDAELLIEMEKGSFSEGLREISRLKEQLKKIISNPSTTVVKTYKGSSLRVELKDKNMLEVYKEIQNAEYVTFTLEVEHINLYSGQNAYLDMCARLLDCSKNKKIEKCKRIILLLDEGELFLHPQAQVKFIQNLIWFLPEIIKKQIQIVVTTNSPFLLSDIQKSNVLYLQELNQGEGLMVAERPGRTFGTNINSLLINNFFMNEGIIGFQAKDRINHLIQQIASMGDYGFEKDELANMKKTINIIGDDLIRKKLYQCYKQKISKASQIEEEILYHKNKIKELENRQRMIEGE